MNQFTGLNRKRGLSRRDGGTGETAKGAPEVLGKLDVPSLSGNNTFTGENTLTGPLNAQDGVRTQSVVSDGELRLIAAGQVGVGIDVGPYALFDTTGLSANRGVSFPDASGTFALEALRLAYTAQTGTYAILATDCVIHATSGTWTATLPTAVGVAGKLYVVKNSGAGTITLATTSSQTIDGGAPGTVAAGAVTRLVSDGANWFTI